MLICTEASRFALNKLIVCDRVETGCHSKKSDISVFASMLCWSAEPLKVALKVKMISTAYVITYFFEWISVFERVFE